jgi:hypothetical protein
VKLLRISLLLFVACSSSSSTSPADAGADAASPPPPADAGADASQGTFSATLGDAGVESFDDIRGAALATGANQFNITARKGSSGAQVHLQFPGAAAGSFKCHDARVEYTDDSKNVYGTDVMLAGTDCAIDVSASGAVGQHVVGTFSATMRRVDLGPPTTLDVSGSFDVVRQADEQ